MEFEETQLSQITIQVHDIDQVQPSDPIIEAAVEPYHPKKDVQKTVPYELLLEAQKTARQWSFVLGTIASISLLVGGIGIMNIMLATVTERTREIGIRRALGAKRRDIIEQFLIESVVLSGVGGVLGVTLGVTIPFAIVYFASMKAIVTWSSVILSFGISVAVGILFGLYPARRAALMDPHRRAPARVSEPRPAGSGAAPATEPGRRDFHPKTRPPPDRMHRRPRDPGPCRTPGWPSSSDSLASAPSGPGREDRPGNPGTKPPSCK